MVTADGELLALDAKMTFDDNALFRHPEIAGCATWPKKTRTSSGRSRPELRQLDGNIGCLVNGAGLAMSTMDLIKLHGGEPANFLDVGGGANAEQVTEAFRILLADKNVKAVLVNIFGGIMRCETIADGVIAAYQEVGCQRDGALWCRWKARTRTARSCGRSGADHQRHNDGPTR